MGDKIGPENQRISKEIRELFEQHQGQLLSIIGKGGIREDIPVYSTDELIKALARYVMEQTHKSWSHDVKHGVQLGRNDAVRMLESIGKPTMNELWPDKLEAYEDMLKMMEWYELKIAAVIKALAAGDAAGEEQNNG